MKKMLFITLATGILACCSCQKELMNYQKNDLKISITAGKHWLHDFSLFLGIKTKNAPQIAIWLEDPEGHYLSTVYVSHKAATQSWKMADGNRRKEALPCWAYSRGVQYGDGLYLPTKNKPLTDGVSGATPKSSFNVRLHPEKTEPLERFVVKIELNHSTDFNDHYPKSAKKGEPDYSGGKLGSGQPAVVYAAAIDLTTGKNEFEATLIGHSSPDGSDGGINPDVSTMTTALEIAKKITITLEK